jgi:hypothetical protein
MLSVMRTKRKDMKLKWYGVKTLYRWEPVGRPRGKDRVYSSSVTLVEERIVLIRARSAEEALVRGEREAKRYSFRRYRNPYGQPVKTRALGYVNAYIIDERPLDGVEVFSATEVVPRSTSDRCCPSER